MLSIFYINTLNNILECIVCHMIIHAQVNRLDKTCIAVYLNIEVDGCKIIKNSSEVQFFKIFLRRFFISAPAVFHVGVNEKVFVQMGQAYLNTLVTLYLEHESSGTVMSVKKTTSCANEEDIKTVELMV